jgi:uncharacterized protein YkwD
MPISTFPVLHERRRFAHSALNAVTAPLLLPLFSPGTLVGAIVLSIAATMYAWTDEDAVNARADTHVVQTIAYEHEALGAALSGVSSSALTESVVRLDLALQPTPTPSPTNTPRPTATPVPVQVAAPQPQAAQPVAPSHSQPAPPPVTGGCSASMGGQALALFNAMNSERTSRGLAPFATHACATRVGYLRAMDMARRGYFSHTSPDGQTAFSLLDALGAAYSMAGENIARNSYPNPAAIAMQDFMASPGHRDNILSAKFTHAGVGVASGGGGITYFAIVFLSR